MVNGGCWVCRLWSVLMEMARGQLTQCCLSIEHNKFDKQMMEQSDRTLFHRNRVKIVTADTGAEPQEFKIEPFSRGTKDAHGFGEGRNLRSGVRLPRAQVLVAAVIPVAKDYFIVKTEAISLKQGGNLQLSLISCLEA